MRFGKTVFVHSNLQGNIVKIRLIAISKTSQSYLTEGIDVFEGRIKRYLPFSFEELNTPKKWGTLPENKQKEEEGKLLLSKISSDDVIILLDERGKSYTSPDFANFLQKKMNSGAKSLAFVIGGAYGFSDDVYARASDKISLSKMTFSHQMVRLFAIEQIYRGFSILNNEPYHHS